MFLPAYDPVNGEVGMRNPAMHSTFEERSGIMSRPVLLIIASV